MLYVYVLHALKGHSYSLVMSQSKMKTSQLLQAKWREITASTDNNGELNFFI